jgi:hypothetical protein
MGFLELSWKDKSRQNWREHKDHLIESHSLL